MVFLKNGFGKKCILEAIYYLALTRSFKSSFDKNVINYEKEYFHIHGNILNESNKLIKIFLSYEKNGKKQLQFKKRKIKNL